MSRAEQKPRRDGRDGPIVALGVHIRLPRSLVQRGKPIREQQQALAESRVLRGEILDHDDPQTVGLGSKGRLYRVLEREGCGD